MKKHHFRETTNVYLAHGEFNISQFKLRQSLALESHNICIEFGVLQNNYFIRFQKNNHVLTEICTTTEPLYDREQIVAVHDTDSLNEGITKELPFGHYSFETKTTRLSEKNDAISELRSMTNAEHVYKLTHHFPSSDVQGDIVELYLDVSASIQLRTVRICPSAQKLLYTSSELRLF